MQHDLNASFVKRHIIGAFANQLLWRFIDLIYPQQCVGCNEVGTYICERCMTKVELQKCDYCLICGAPIIDRSACGCDQIADKKFILRSWTFYTGIIRDAIHQMKFENDIGLCYYFAKKMKGRYFDLHWDVDLVVPVPLSRERYRERGYNQSSLIAKPLASMINRKYAGNALGRIRHTRSQVDLDAMDRLENVENAFQASAEKVTAKKILLVDDIATTCATIAECSKVLTSAGAEKVFALTLARTKLY